MVYTDVECKYDMRVFWLYTITMDDRSRNVGCIGTVCLEWSKGYLPATRPSAGPSKLEEGMKRLVPSRPVSLLCGGERSDA